MLLFLSLIGIFLSAVLLFFNAGNNKSTIYLGLFFALISLYGFNQYVLIYSKSVFLVSIIFINSGSLPFLAGPMLYWYVRSVLKDDPKLKKWDLLHFLPIIIFLTASFPHILSPYSYKVQIAARIVGDSDYLETFKAIGLYEIIPISAIYKSRPLLVLGYSVWSAILFIRYLLQREKRLVLSRQCFMTKWLTVLLSFTTILVVSHFLILTKAFISENTIVFFTLNFFQILSAAGLTGLLISPFFFPEILYGLPRLPESEGSLPSKEGGMKLLNEEGKKHPFHLESGYLVYIGQRTDECMNEFQPYLQPDFNLAQLSVLIHIPVHHLSFYFKKEKKQHFIDFRNTLRIDHAKILIKKGKAKGMTLEAIGLLSGFSSRNAFFTAFKKAERISPGTFAAQSTE